MAESLENLEEILDHGVSALSSTLTGLTLISTTKTTTVTTITSSPIGNGKPIGQFARG